MGIIAEITTTRTGGSQGFGLIVPGDRMIPISPRIGDLFHLARRARVGMSRERKGELDPGRMMLQRAVVRSVGTPTRTRDGEGRRNRPDHVYRKRSAQAAIGPSILV